jgi:hypothetical protein
MPPLDSGSRPGEDENQFRAAADREITHLKQTDEGTKQLFE